MGIIIPESIPLYLRPAPKFSVQQIQTGNITAATTTVALVMVGSNWVSTGGSDGSTSRCLFLIFPGSFSSIVSDAVQGSFKSWVNFCSSRTSAVISLIHSNPLFWQHIITLSSGSYDVPSWMDSTLFFQHLMGKQDPSKYPSPAWLWTDSFR